MTLGGQDFRPENATGTGTVIWNGEAVFGFRTRWAPLTSFKLGEISPYKWLFKWVAEVTPRSGVISPYF